MLLQNYRKRTAQQVMPPRSLFISDLHLCAEQPQIWDAFVAFCDAHPQPEDHLFILGDLVDSWIGDDDDGVLAVQLAEQLKALTERGVQLAFMRGNRDFLMGTDFCSRIGMKLLPDPCRLMANGKTVILTHGDSLCTLDKAYMAVRRQFRSLAWQQKFLALPLEQRREAVRQMRSESTAYKTTRPEKIMDAVPADIERQLRCWHADTMIHGHTHRPAVHKHQVDDRTCTRYVLSDWRPEGNFLQLDGDGCRLIAC